jgi:DNA-binding GntR family transcriptional regulator
MPQPVMTQALKKAPSEASLRLKPRALYEDVAELLRQRIFSNALEPGQWIDELQLAEEFGISRTPLREAIKVLAAEGLVTMKVRRGAYVTEVNANDLRDVFHLMALLEADAAAQVAKQASNAQLAELEALHHQLEKAAKDRAKFFALNEQFHFKLLELARNKWRDQIVTDLRKVMKLNRAQSLLKSGRIEESLNEHRQLMAALQKRDAKAARSAMQAHIANGLEAAAPVA